ncbi:hypothetical protein [Acaryochloris sp. CCMEE 5410]|uniref:hypothetical protein n=1 Tax=Acaryochloris sp. CCMEE 5410 TaxID=310037 RepID=UPI0002485169|nr:hypothetical protein [Acaryochloris sp. CCMEE 5410]KAI9130148.1 hypothetical protein ON05_031470 [Acaryochloris sp. CCMEE 5410]
MADHQKVGQGTKAENWIKGVAKDYQIQGSIAASVEDVIKLFGKYHDHKLKEATFNFSQRKELKPYPDALNFIDQTLHGIKGQKTALSRDPQFKQTLKDVLLDQCLATDLLVKVKDLKGQEQTIAIDVTVNPNSLPSKLNVIQGKHKNSNPGKKFNTNRNMPLMRERLGIDKHMVLCLDSKQYPPKASVLEAIYAFANEAKKTTVTDLSDQETLKQFKPPEPTKDEKTALIIADAARGLLTGLKLGVQKGNALEFKSKSFTFQQQGNTVSLSAPNRGEILRVKDNIIQVNKLNKEDIQRGMDIVQRVNSKLQRPIPGQNKPQQRLPSKRLKL